MSAFDRPLPANVEAERAVVGAMLHGVPGVYDRVLPIVAPSAFRDPCARLVYEAVASMDGKGVDLLTVKEALQTAGKLEKAGGPAAVASLTDHVPDIANVEKYARIVRDFAQRRSAIIEAQRLQNAAWNGEPISDIAARGALVFSDMTAEHDDGPSAIADIARRCDERLEQRLASDSWLTGIPTGLRSLDAYTLGIQRGVLSVIGARPRVGKTALSLSIALHAVEHGYRAMLVELDMSEAMTADRIRATLSGVPLFKIRSGRGLDTAREMARIVAASAKERAYRDRLLIDYRMRDMAKVAATIRRASRANGLDLVIVDHIGHVQGGRGEKRYLQIGDVSARLVELAADTNAGIIALSQLNRDAETRPPLLADLRECGNLEQDARLVVLLDRPSLRGEPVPECRLNLLVQKNEGETGELQAHFDLVTQRIEENSTCKECAADVARVENYR